MKYLNSKVKDLKAKGDSYAALAKKICSQFDLWEQTYSKFLRVGSKLLKFFEKLWENDNPLILAGAGIPPFIDALIGAIQKKGCAYYRLIGTIDSICLIR